jgi:hypothetical protein
MKGAKLTMFGRKATKYVPYGRANGAQTKVGKQHNKQQIERAKRQTYQEKVATNRARQARNLESRNPIRRKLAQLKQSSIKKQEVKIRKLESDAKLAELNPTLQAEKAKADNEIKVEKARYRSKTASSAALATGMATLGRGLSDENNQDDEARRKADQKVIETIFQPNPETTDDTSGNTGLSQGVE